MQVDGAGWSLWAAGLVVDQITDADARAVAVRAAAAAGAAVDRLPGAARRRRRPPAAVARLLGGPESELTLGTAAPLVAGLQSATAARRLSRTTTTLARTASPAADRLRAAVVSGFEPTGWARYARGGLPDAAVAFTLAPFWREPSPGARLTWIVVDERRCGGRRAVSRPGAGWRDDGISWTPQTSLYAWVAAEQGDRDPRDRAGSTSIDQHRTPSGAIPEKILADGSPASVAPLAWSAACVVLAVDALGTTP